MSELMKYLILILSLLLVACDGSIAQPHMRIIPNYDVTEYDKKGKVVRVYKRLEIEPREQHNSLVFRYGHNIVILNNYSVKEYAIENPNHPAYKERSTK